MPAPIRLSILISYSYIVCIDTNICRCLSMHGDPSSSRLSRTPRHRTMRESTQTTAKKVKEAVTQRRPRRLQPQGPRDHQHRLPGTSRVHRQYLRMRTRPNKKTLLVKMTPCRQFRNQPPRRCPRSENAYHPKNRHRRLRPCQGKRRPTRPHRQRVRSTQAMKGMSR